MIPAALPGACRQVIAGEDAGDLRASRSWTRSSKQEDAGLRPELMLADHTPLLDYPEQLWSVPLLTAQAQAIVPRDGKEACGQARATSNSSHFLVNSLCPLR